MGDDLIFAQKFTHTAVDGLTLLAEMEDPRAAQDAAVVIDMMTTVQRGAKRLRARHIYSGAQDVLSALHHDKDAVLKGRIINLGGLVTKYARGLDELLQAQNAEQNIVSSTPSDKWDIARETLNALLPTASTDHADMLSRLMRAPVTVKSGLADQEAVSLNADVIPFVKPEDLSVSLEKELAEEPSTKDFSLEDSFSMSQPSFSSAPKIEMSPSITLDAMMRDVIADALSVARSVRRTISVSYDMGERAVSAESAENLRERMGLALSQIIRQSVTDDRVGHIDVNLAGEQLHIMAGTTAIRVAITPAIQPTSRARITDETEVSLRAQLHALMDPIALNETVS